MNENFAPDYPIYRKSEQANNDIPAPAVTHFSLFS